MDASVRPVVKSILTTQRLLSQSRIELVTVASAAVVFYPPCTIEGAFDVCISLHSQRTSSQAAGRYTDVCPVATLAASPLPVDAQRLFVCRLQQKQKQTLVGVTLAVLRCKLPASILSQDLRLDSNDSPLSPKPWNFLGIG